MTDMTEEERAIAFDAYVKSCSVVGVATEEETKAQLYVKNSVKPIKNKNAELKLGPEYVPPFLRALRAHRAH